ncbi:MAG TPA: hypothetical protein VK326_05055 [Solirubrobacterales bacterium]|nr:hypothetical protein [Solirubrobacterales bacterium]
MRRLVPLVLRPWTLPLIVLALIVPSIAAFSLVGPQLGVAVGALTATVLIGIAARMRFEEEIEVAPSPDERYRMLVVSTGPIENPAIVERVAELAEEGTSLTDGSPATPQLLVLAPAQPSLLDRWATDLRAARDLAHRALVMSLASFAAAGIDATGKVGDADPVQAIEDELHTFAAREVVLVDGPGIGHEQVEEVRRRLDRPVREIDSRV